MDQYVSWNLSPNELTLDTIWGKYKEYCKPQSNKVWARFDLLMSFRQRNCSVDEWYNAIQAQVNFAKYPLETAKILHRDIFWFFLKDEDFMSRTISDGSIDLDKFPASRVCQLAKKLESSKASVRHIKQVSREPQMTQINLLHTDTRRKGLTQNSGRVTISHAEMTNTMVKYNTRSKVTTNHQLQTDHHPQTTSIDVQSVEILPIMKDSHAQLRNTNARHVINSDILPVNISKGNSIHNINLDNPKHTKYKWMSHMTTHTITHQMSVPVKIPSVCK